jgi:spore germination cell wall hydrolase CwlJ-like protein
MTRSTACLAAVATLAFTYANPRVALAQEADTSSLSADKSLSNQTVPVFVQREIVQPLLPIAPGAPANAQRTTAQSLAEMVTEADTSEPLTEEMRCLAGTVYFEARGEPLYGQLAVAEVVINRSRSGQFPKTYCGVVYQRSQFSFIRRGTMPRIDEASAAWRQARAIAQIAHHDHWNSQAEEALYFHANYVRPSWAKRRVAAATINRHIFYR